MAISANAQKIYKILVGKTGWGMKNYSISDLHEVTSFRLVP